MHIGPIKTSEELNSAPHPLYEMGGRKHYEAQYSDSWKHRPHLKCVGPTDHS